MNVRPQRDSHIRASSEQNTLPEGFPLQLRDLRGIQYSKAFFDSFYFVAHIVVVCFFTLHLKLKVLTVKEL